MKYYEWLLNIYWTYIEHILNYYPIMTMSAVAWWGMKLSDFMDRLEQLHPEALDRVPFVDP